MTQEIITITVEAGQMTARRKTLKIAQHRPVPVWAIVKYAALTIAGIMLFREGAARALAYRGYFAVGGEVFALFLPVFYYCLSRTVRDLTTLSNSPAAVLPFTAGSMRRTCRPSGAVRPRRKCASVQR